MEHICCQPWQRSLYATFTGSWVKRSFQGRRDGVQAHHTSSHVLALNALWLLSRGGLGGAVTWIRCSDINANSYERCHTMHYHYPLSLQRPSFLRPTNPMYRI